MFETSQGTKKSTLCTLYSIQQVERYITISNGKELFEIAYDYNGPGIKIQN